MMGAGAAALAPGLAGAPAAVGALAGPSRGPVGVYHRRVQAMSIKIDFFHDVESVRTVAAGETIFEEGDPGDVMYGVQEGTVDILFDGQVIETVGPGGIFGEMALIDREPRCATVVAKTDCRLAAVDESNFLFKTQHNPIFALFVMQVIARRLRRETRIRP
jgi:CRP/FNR family cyclic AMP-dependent transcriptional regulator